MKNIDLYVSEKLVIGDDVKLTRLKHTRERKTKIDKKDADYIAWVYPKGPLTPTTGRCGDTKNIFDNEHKDNFIYFLGIKDDTTGKPLRIDYGVIGDEKILKEGDKIHLMHNDTQKKVGSYGRNEIVGICKCTKDDFDKFMRKNNYFSKVHGVMIDMIDQE